MVLIFCECLHKKIAFQKQKKKIAIGTINMITFSAYIILFYYKEKTTTLNQKNVFFNSLSELR
jgi:hypothetical protein